MTTTEALSSSADTETSSEDSVDPKPVAMSRSQDEQNEDLVYLFKVLIPFAAQDTDKDGTLSPECFKIGDYYVNEHRLGRVLRTIRAANER